MKNVRGVFISYQSIFWKSEDVTIREQQKSIIETYFKNAKNKLDKHNNMNSNEACIDRMIYFLCENLLREFK